MEELDLGENKLGISAEGRPVIIRPDGTTIEMTENGSKIVKADGSIIEALEDGGVNVNLPNLKSVGIKNIIDVASYEIVNEQGLITHRILFRNGGSVVFSYTQEGKIKEFSGNNISQTITMDNDVIVGANWQNEDES